MRDSLRADLYTKLLANLDRELPERLGLTSPVARAEWGWNYDTGGVCIDDLPDFDSADHRSWLVDIPSDREHYLSLISTYSTMLRLPDDNRQALFACIGDLMDREFGGQITKRYRYDLVVRMRR